MCAAPLALWGMVIALADSPLLLTRVELLALGIRCARLGRDSLVRVRNLKCSSFRLLSDCGAASEHTDGASVVCRSARSLCKGGRCARSGMLVLSLELLEVLSWSSGLSKDISRKIIAKNIDRESSNGVPDSDRCDSMNMNIW